MNISKIFFRIFPSVIGGFLGTLAFLGAFLLLQLPLSDNSAYSTFSVLIIAFVGAIIGNLLASFFLIISNKDKFQTLKIPLSNIFIANMLLFFMLIPLCVMSENNAMSIIGFYFIFTIFISSIILEILSKSLHMISIIFISTIAFLILVIFSKIYTELSGGLIAILLFTIPVSWLLFSTFSILGEVLERLIKKNS